MTRGYLVGLDMGGTNIRTAAVSLKGDVLLMLRGPAKADGSGAQTVENIVGQILALEAAAEKKRFGRALAIGVAVPGPLNVTTGVVYAAPHVKAWREFPLKREIERRLGRRIVLENDANAWALGEFWRGAARGKRYVVLLTLGTGVGGGVIVDGKIVHGRTGIGGELGHVTVEADGIRCDCGSRGCLESYASASGMRRMLERRLGVGEGGRLPSVFLDSSGEFSARGLTTAARRGNPLAREILAESGRYLGIAIASFLNIFNPEMMVIGGGVAGSMPFMRAAMLKEVRSRAFAAAVKQAIIVRAALGPTGGVVGAAFAAKSLIPQ